MERGGKGGAKKIQTKGSGLIVFFSSCLFGSLFSYLFNDESFPLKPLLAWLTPGKRAAVQATGRKRVQAVQEPAGAAAAVSSLCVLPVNAPGPVHLQAILHARVSLPCLFRISFPFSMFVVNSGDVVIALAPCISGSSVLP